MAWIIKCWIPIDYENTQTYDTSEELESTLENLELMHRENKYDIVGNQIKCWIPIDADDPEIYHTRELAQADIDGHYALMQPENIYETLECKILKQVFIVNSDLDMRKGKVGVQIGHGETHYMNMIKNLAILKERSKCVPNTDNGASDSSNQRMEMFEKWFSEGELMKKVVLKASEKDIISMRSVLLNRDIWSDLVYDAGLTQIPEHSLTCMVVEPLLEDFADEIFAHLKLL